MGKGEVAAHAYRGTAERFIGCDLPVGMAGIIDYRTGYVRSAGYVRGCQGLAEACIVAPLPKGANEVYREGICEAVFTPLASPSG